MAIAVATTSNRGTWGYRIEWGLVMELITQSEAARRLGISRQAVFAAVMRGALEPANRDRMVYANAPAMFTEAEVEEVVNRYAKTLDLYDVVTPEITYLSCSISHYDYRRTSSQGVGLVVVDVWVSLVIVQNAGTMTASSVVNAIREIIEA